MNYEIELKIAKKAALSAGKILKNFTTNLGIKFKETKDIVTNADILSQQTVISIIKEVFPNDYILTEEGSHEFNKNRTWVIDPLDGTVNFSRNIPLYGVSIAFFEQNKVKVAVTYLPVLNELYYAVKGEGCYCNDEKVSVSTTSEPNKAILNFNDFNIASESEMKKYNDNKLKLINKVHNNCMRLKNFSSAVLEFAYVVSSKIDVYFMIFCGYWDIAAGILMIEEAGGKITDFNGNEITPNSKFIIASNGILHNYYIDLINDFKFK